MESNLEENTTSETRFEKKIVKNFTAQKKCVLESWMMTHQFSSNSLAIKKLKVETIGIIIHEKLKEKYF